MRIWIVNHYGTPPGAVGGPTRHLGLAQALRDRGHDVVILASLFDHYSRRPHRPSTSRPWQVETIEGITFVWFATPPYGRTLARIRNMVEFWWSVRRRARSLPLAAPDVVIGSSPHLLAPLAARRVARSLGAAFVVEVRDIWPQSLVDLGSFSRVHPAMVVLRAIERTLYRSAGRVIVVPPLAVDHVVTSGGSPGAVDHLPNGVRIDAWSATPAPSTDRPFVVLYAGTIGHANGLDLVVEAAHALQRRDRSDIRIRLVGAGPERERLRRRVDELELQAIQVEDPVPSDAVPALLAEAHACLLVLRDSPVFEWGISPTKLFEYLAAARPVITSVRTPDDIVGRAGAGLTATPGDAASLADMIETMADLDRSEREAMGQRGRAFVEAHHSFEQLAARLERSLEAAIAASKQAGRAR